MLDKIWRIASRRWHGYPSREYFNRQKRTLQHTPDVLELERQMYQNVFVYDEMQEGLWKNDVMEALGAVRVCTAFTYRRFSMFKHALGRVSYPIMLDKEYHICKHLRVLGTIYKVPSTAMVELDNLKQNGVLYRRKELKFLVPLNVRKQIKRRFYVKNAEGKMERVNQTIQVLEDYRKLYITTAWAYIGKQSYWDDVMTDADYKNVRDFEPKQTLIGPYYYFTQLELNV